MIIGVDLGNKSRNAICVVDSNNKLLEEISFDYKDAKTTWHHRKAICKQINDYIKKYKMTKNDYLIFEEVAFYPGKSRTDNIVSMSFIQATIINEFSNKISICAVHVQSWKSKVLGSRSATKEDAVEYIEKHYPKVNLDIIEHHPKKGDIIIKDHDKADSICIAIFGNMVGYDYLNNKLVNYQ